MMFGMSLAAFTTLHTVVSVFALLAGLVIAGGMLGGRTLPGWTLFFLVTTAYTDLSGFFLPADRILPSHIVGVVSLVALVVAAYAYYARELVGRARGVYVASAMFAAWLNAFVLFAQLFGKVPAMKELAPTPASPLFGVTQLIVLVVFVILGWRALRSFHPVVSAPAM